MVASRSQMTPSYHISEKTVHKVGCRLTCFQRNRPRSNQRPVFRWRRIRPTSIIRSNVTSVTSMDIKVGTLLWILRIGQPSSASHVVDRICEWVTGKARRFKYSELIFHHCGTWYNQSHTVRKQLGCMNCGKKCDAPNMRNPTLVNQTPVASDTATLFLFQIGELGGSNECLWRIVKVRKHRN